MFCLNIDINIHMSYDVITLTTVCLIVVYFSAVIYSHLLYAIVCILKSFVCHDIKHAMSYYIMEFYVTTCHMSQLSRHP